MKNPGIQISSDISTAYTLPSEFYRSQTWFDQTKDSIFARSWQCIGLESDAPLPGAVLPFPLMSDTLNEPLVLARSESGKLSCLSNVCTHRGNILAYEAGPCKQLRCRYHGRRFDLEGKMLSMPEFKEAKNFPSAEDNLPKLPIKKLGELLFTSLNPDCKFEDWLAPMLNRLSWMPFDQFHHAAEYSQTYEVNAHWALYLDNYLEGFHIPFVHPGLNEVLSYPDYGYELYDHGSLQLGIGKEGEQSAFIIPSSSPDFGKNISAYYYWFFPNIMFNIYPWGLSLNLVEPVNLRKTRIRFETFIWREELFDPSATEAIHQTELEDEEVVESVQMGIQSRLYKRGRYSPKQERAVHHFHRMIADRC